MTAVVTFIQFNKVYFNILIIGCITSYTYINGRRRVFGVVCVFGIYVIIKKDIIVDIESGILDQSLAI